MLKSLGVLRSDPDRVIIFRDNDQDGEAGLKA